MSRVVVVVVALALAVMAGCYDPRVATGVPCGPGGACPQGQRCNSAEVCEPSSATPVDAPSDGTDAAGDAALDAFAPHLPIYRGVTTAHGEMTVTVAAPQGTEPGDLLLAHLAIDSDDLTDIVIPIGWTRIAQRAVSANAFGAVIIARPASNETTHEFRARTAAPFGAALMAFANIRTNDPVDAVDDATGAASTSATIPSVTTTVDNALLLAFLTEDIATAPYTPPDGMTAMHNEPSGTNFVMMGAYELRPIAGPTGPRVATTTDEGPYIAFAVALAPR